MIYFLLLKRDKLHEKQDELLQLDILNVEVSLLEFLWEDGLLLTTMEFHFVSVHFNQYRIK